MKATKKKKFKYTVSRQNLRASLEKIEDGIETIDAHGMSPNAVDESINEILEEIVQLREDILLVST